MVKTIKDLELIKEQTLARFGSRIGNDDDRVYIMTCCGTGCTSSGSYKNMAKIQELIERDECQDKVFIVKTGCFGLCAEGPILVVYPGNTMYTNVQEDDINEIWESHIKNGVVVERLTSENEQNFFNKQMRISLRNCGRINPEDIDEYIAYDGYKALSKVLTEMEPDEVIQLMKDSGLRGRGGGGFPTGVKWDFAAKQQQKEKYVCCNADEGDPGAFMDRSVLEGDPHSVIESMAIAGYAIGSNMGYVYVRAEYPIAVERLSIAIEQAREYGILGDNVLGTGFKFDIEIRLGAGAFVCGEETALIASIEGGRGEPTLKPPFPAVEGLFDKPTILNNVETFSNIPQIIINGPEWFKGIGTETSKGTKVFALGGKINNTGLVEVPMGTHIGAKAIPTVKVGDVVEEAQQIAKAAEGLSIPQFASISGKVTYVDENKVVIEAI